MENTGNDSTIPCSIEKMIKEQGYFIYTNVGTSMMPLLRQRKDLIEIKHKEADRCKKYDVVLYKRGEKYILHRILKVLPDGYLIAGDHCTFVERDIKDEHILGVLTRVIRNGRTITPNNLWYKAYVHLWCDCYPVRMGIIKGKQKMNYVLRAVKKIILHDSQNDKESHEQQSSAD